jgi:hypothetical protein
MLELRPIEFSDAVEFVRLHHRHHKPPIGHKYSIACYDDDRLCGVAIMGRPVSRYLDNGRTMEVYRNCTDGTKNACSMLYGAAWRVAQGLGYNRIFTYTLESENGASLRASNWHFDGQAGGPNWTGERYRQEELFPEMKNRWSKTTEQNKEA